MARQKSMIRGLVLLNGTPQKGNPNFQRPPKLFGKDPVALNLSLVVSLLCLAVAQVKLSGTWRSVALVSYLITVVITYLEFP